MITKDHIVIRLDIEEKGKRSSYHFNLPEKFLSVGGFLDEIEGLIEARHVTALDIRIEKQSYSE